MRGLLLLTMLFAGIGLTAQNNRITTITCNNWLSLPSQPAYATIGKLNITGNQVTVEALINRTSFLSNGVTTDGDIVSKHTTPSDVNYLLRPTGAQITTSNGFFSTPAVCGVQLNKVYHVAMTYNGAVLRFYRNGYLISSVAATGNLVQNAWDTYIGYYAGALPENFAGYINEVRIWNVARSQADIRAYMNGSLPNPTTQAGLQAYYTFDNLLNKQGNPAWDGTLAGSASINATNPTCNYVIDSCNVIVPTTANFTAPDTVCVNTPVNINNTSVGASTYYWIFCPPDLNINPQATNLGNIGNILSQPSFMDFVNDNGNYYGFSNNYYPGKLVRLDFGNSLLNTPTVTDLGNFGGIIPVGPGAEGIQVVKNEGKWYAIIVGGSPNGGSSPRIIKIDFGAAITNPAPTATNWGNIGTLAQPVDLMLFAENGAWYGLTVNSENNTITRFNFTGSFDNTPTGTNLGNLGNLNYPLGLFAVNDNGVWRAFITNGAYNSPNPVPSITRLDFGNSLLNLPTAVNLGNPGNLLSQPRDITIFSSCGQAFGYIVDGNSHIVVKLNFNGNLQSTPVATSLGNIGNLSFPHSISKLFRSGSDLYAFVTNINNNTITRLRFTGCTNSSSPNSTVQNPAPITYTTPGTYTISLAIDEGLITQSTYCRKVVVLAKPTVSTRSDTALCPGGLVQLTTAISGATTFSWSPATGLSNPSAASPAATPAATTTYIITASNGYCQAKDTVVVNVTANCNSISNIINAYTPVTSVAPCTNGIVVEDASAFKAGDTVLLIQMKGAVIDSTNTGSFGTIATYQNAGNYEFNYVSAISGNVLSLKNGLTRQYSIPNGKVQLIRVPYFLSTSVSSTLTCLPWDGKKGGVLAFNVRDTLTLNADMDVSGKGFRGGSGVHGATNTLNCYQSQYYYPANSYNASEKGEGLYETAPDKVYGRGKLANGGGGGNSHNSGGGGGSNAGGGGFGGYQYEFSDCSTGTVPFDNRGIGGQGLTYNNTVNKIYLGGGAGSGQANNPELFYPKGGNGGGIIIVSANTVQGNAKNILSRGADADACAAPGTGCHEGMGGGGGGGTILLSTSQVTGTLSCQAPGGKGGDMVIGGNGRLGAGGGGGGGIVWFKQIATPAGVSVNIAGGINGKNTNNSNDAWGTTAGQAGTSAFNLTIATDTTLFAKNIDSVRIKDSLTACFNFDFKGLAFVRSAPVTIWQWAFGDGGTASTQNTSHQYTASGTYTVKLVVTDANGCKDSTAKTVVVASCNTISNIINAYTPVTGYQPCDNKITVESDTAFSIGDTVLLIQMKGAIIDTTNSAAFGTVTDYGNTGNYEFNYVKSKANNVIELTNKLTRNYTIPAGKVQLIRVPYFISTSVSSTLTCLPWDGSKGGVLAFNVRDALTLNADIDVSGKGFRGGSGQHGTYTDFNCTQSQYYYPNDPYQASQKGEGIATLSPGKVNGKGKNANGGGGGNSHNAGGAGGSNAGTGGLGGYETDAPVCSPGGIPTDNRASGGQALAYNNTANKVFLGGGAGSGHANNVEMFYPKGGNGGGIAFISAGSVVANNRSILLKGENAASCGTNTTGCHEGMGGGGGGGTLLFNVNTVSGTLTCNTSGGNGGDMIVSGYGKQGPGGGGGGGVTWVKQAAVPGINIFQSGGNNGVTTAYGNNPWGAVAGQAGTAVLNLVIPVDTVLFSKNIDSVKINDSVAGCSAFAFKGLAYTRSNPIVSWQWSFGDGGTATAQNTTHTYANTGNFLVKLLVKDANGCIDSASKTVTVTSGRVSDFSFRIDPCQPLGVQFVGTVGSLPIQNFWSFGDNSGTINNQSPNHLFAGPGNYTVRYSNPLGNCVDTITKIISVGAQYQDIVRTPDTTLCYGTPGRIRTDSGSAFCWFPVIYLNDPLLANPLAAPLQPVTYHYTSIVAGNNLLVNSNFSSGNTGFTTDYAFATTNTGSQQYNIGTNAGSWLGSTVACSSDHTTGTGNMLMVNGSTTANSKIWAQTLPVTPNTNYEIAGWLANLSTIAPASVQVRIDGLLLDTAIAVTGTTCNWHRFSTLWNSGTKTSIELALVNISTAAQGNDFAIDDLSFAPVGIKTDSININLERPAVRTGNDTAICYGDTTRLQANGAVSYTWSPAGGLDNPASAAPLAFPTASTRYIVTGTTLIGCVARDTIDIQIKPAPTITNLTPDTTVCRNATVQLNAGGGVSYSWQPAATLSNSSIPNPVATPSATTMYRVKVTGTNSCAASDSVKVSIQLPPSFTVKTIAPVCSGSSVQLLASGGNEYLWSPATGLSATGISNPVATVSGTIQYSVKIKEAVCQDSTILTVPVNVLPNPAIRASRSNDINCNLGVATLTATGGQSYRWAPGSPLSDSNAASPRATPAISTYYTVIGTGSNGCSAADSVLVTVKYEANGMHYLPNAFTPNGDGLNDCFGVRNWGMVTDLKFSIYNRYGELMFYTSNPATCWDGRYKNEVQQSGNFIYIIQAKTSCGEVNMKGSILLIR